MPTTTGNASEVENDSHLGIIIGVQTALTVLAVIVVSLRLYVRTRLVRSFGRDDWTMAIAGACHGLGRHIQFIDSMDQMRMNQAAFWQVIICSATGMAFLKTSIALNLLRFSPARWYAVCLWASIGFVVAYNFMAAMTFFLHCKPMQAHWDTRIKDAKCYPVNLFVDFALINTSFNIFTDVLFATVPIPIVWNLQMKRRVRFYLIGVFSLGYIAVGMGVVKAVYQIAYATDLDSFFNDSIMFWALVQFNIGILAACVPSLKPLVSKALKLSEYTNSRSRSRGVYGSSAGGAFATSRNSRRVWSMQRRDQYALEELQSSDASGHRDSDDVQLTGASRGPGPSYTTQVDAGAVSEEDGRHSPGRHVENGILKTTQCTVVSMRAAD
ncbi:predicted protein [Aspergillus terreus NIH2624]|uniref:Rhodopsin domain-containing protein n=1 Tax=Aspergillus terreus (strain NIH 2624 / FGSC A1156) TaxID=341663 RepID=Q0CUE5_ASPTN|nr:uncharacterized protein ATEG_02689 [Aspergillus terreus NIH2624]EAU37651.1 predicted protein [Aspergillus terreus NIH2624]